MKRISIERYGAIPDDVPRPADPALTPAQDLYSGLIEGERDDGTTWVMWLDNNGSPAVFWAQRDETGAVVGDAISLY